MRWLVHWIGLERILDAQVILPTDEFFPDPYHGDEASARRWLTRMCRYMRVDPATVTLVVFPDEAAPGAAGYYQQGAKTCFPVTRARSQISVAASQLANPSVLVATLAHELGHEILLGGGKLTTDVTDHEQITDLLMVFLGVGIFNANATIVESHWNYGATYSGWSIGRQGYLSSFVFGYALALFAFFRRELNPTWAKHLRKDARETLWKALRYLKKTGDSLFHPDTIRTAYSRPTASVLEEGLTHTSPTFRLAALWELNRTGLASPELFPIVWSCVNDRDFGVRDHAARSLALFGSQLETVVPQLVDLLRTECDIWRSIVPALTSIRACPDAVVPELARLLTRHPNDHEMLANALRLYGSAAEAAFPALLGAFGHHLARGGLGNLLSVMDALIPDLEQRIRDHFVTDPEARKHALWELRQYWGGSPL
jgi:hypothetical protein